MTDISSLSLNDIIEKAAAHPRLRVTFHSHTFGAGEHRDPNTPAWVPESTALTAYIPGNELAAVMRKIQANGGIGAETPDGTLIWLPWPVAAVTVQAAPDTPSS